MFARSTLTSHNIRIPLSFSSKCIITLILSGHLVELYVILYTLRLLALPRKKDFHLFCNADSSILLKGKDFKKIYL